MNRLIFELTTRCNLKCRHCLRAEEEKPLDLSPALFEKVLRQAKDAYGINLCSFTGGEPLMHPDLETIFEIINELDYSFSLVTNGHLIAKRLALFKRPQIAKRITNVAVSLEGPDETTHDSIRGPGSFRKVMAAIILIKDLGLHLTVKFTLGTHNLDRLEESILAMSHLGANRMEISHLHPTPENLAAGLVPSPAQMREAEARVYRMKNEMKMAVDMTAGLYSPQSFYTCVFLAMADLYVNARGWLGFCCVLPGARGPDPGQTEPDLIADLNQVDLWQAQASLLDAISGYQKDRLARIGRGELNETDHFQCISCARYFGKLDWLEQHGDSPWRRSAGGGEVRQT